MRSLRTVCLDHCWRPSFLLNWSLSQGAQSDRAKYEIFSCCSNQGKPNSVTWHKQGLVSWQYALRKELFCPSVCGERETCTCGSCCPCWPRVAGGVLEQLILLGQQHQVGRPCRGAPVSVCCEPQKLEGGRRVITEYLCVRSPVQPHSSYSYQDPVVVEVLLWSGIVLVTSSV